MIVLSPKAVFSGDCDKHRKKIERHISHGHCPRDVYYLLLRSEKAQGLMDIINGRELSRLPVYEDRTVAVGIARSRAEAVDIAAMIISLHHPEKPGLKDRICCYYKF